MHRRLSAAILATATTITLAAGATPAVAAPAQTAEASSSQSCVSGPWPNSVKGRPDNLESGSARGVYLWHNSKGWHLRATHPGSKKVVFTGTITATAPMRKSNYRLEGADRAWLSADRKTLKFRFTNYGHLDGIDFRTGCANAIRVTGRINGTQLTSAQVFLGDRSHPTSVPFRIERLR